MVYSDHSQHGWVTCGNCGTAVEDTPEANTDYATRGCDVGYGTCCACGGDRKAKAFRKRRGTNYCAFIDHRIPILADALSEANRAKFLAMPYERQCRVIEGMITKGLMI